MGRRIPAAARVDSGEHATGAGADPRPRDGAEAAGWSTVGAIAHTFQRIIQHCWPAFNAWLAALPDTRFRPFIEYDQKFLVWWGLLLFCCKLGSRRQLDFDLRDAATEVRRNVNRLAGTAQSTLPVHDTLDHFLGHLGSAPLAALRTQMIRRLLRMKMLDGARLLGRIVIAIDGTGHLHFRQRHCAQCLVRHHPQFDSYLHMVEEAKLLGPGGLALSIETAFIENADRPSPVGRDPETWKQDCELAAFRRLVPVLHEAHPQTAICVTSDALYACAPAVRLVEAQGWAYIFTFKQGNAQTAWTEFQAVLTLCPENVLRLTLADETQQVYRWATGMTADDAERRPYQFNALLCEETVKGTTTTFVWMTNLPVSRETVIEIATKGGRRRWSIEAGFNIQKQRAQPGARLQHRPRTDQGLLLSAADRPHGAATAGEREPAPAPGRAAWQDDRGVLWESQKHCASTPRESASSPLTRRAVPGDATPHRFVLTEPAGGVFRSRNRCAR